MLRVFWWPAVTSHQNTYHHRMLVQLVPIPEADLPALERGLIPPRLLQIAAPGGPPPRAVADIRQRLAAGKPAFWVGMFYIVCGRQPVRRAAGVKDAPRAREVGYGIAPRVTPATTPAKR